MPRKTDIEWIMKYKKEAIESVSFEDAIQQICQYNGSPMLSAEQALRVVELAYNVGFGHGYRKTHQKAKISEVQLERLIKGDSLDNASQNCSTKQSQ